MSKPLAASHPQARQEICDAALELVKQGGTAAVSMRAIARALDSSAMMPYTYFASKDELLLDLRIRLFDRFALAMSDTLAGARPEERIPRLVQAYLACGLERPDEYLLMFDRWRFEDYDMLREKYPADHFRSSGPWDIMRDCIALSRPLGDIRCLDLLTHLVWCQLHGLVMLHLSHKLVFGMKIADLTAGTLAAVEAILFMKKDEGDGDGIYGT